MTIDQITTLMPEERNRLIAEHLGWKFEPMSGPRSLPWRKPNVAAWDGEHWSGRATDIPNYCGSLDLMHEAEKTLTHEQQDLYIDALLLVIIVPAEAEYGSIQLSDSDTTWMILHSTPGQRAIAFLATVLTP